MVIREPIWDFALLRVREGGQGWLCPLHPKALGRAAAFAGNWDSPYTAPGAPAASALQQQHPQSS